MDSDLQEEVTSASVENEAKAGYVTVELEVNLTDVNVEEMAQDDAGSLNHDILPSRMAGRLGSHGLKWREWRGEDTGIPF